MIQTYNINDKTYVMFFEKYSLIYRKYDSGDVTQLQICSIKLKNSGVAKLPILTAVYFVLVRIFIILFYIIGNGNFLSFSNTPET